MEWTPRVITLLTTALCERQKNRRLLSIRLITTRQDRTLSLRRGYLYPEVAERFLAYRYPVPAAEVCRERGPEITNVPWIIFTHSPMPRVEGFIAAILCLGSVRHSAGLLMNFPDNTASATTRELQETMVSDALLKYA